MTQSTNPLIIDVREPIEFSEGHVPLAINIPLGNIAADTKNAAPFGYSTKIIVYCRSGNRSHQAMQILKNMGYTNVINGINMSSMGY